MMSMSRRAFSFGGISAGVLALIGCGGKSKESAALICEPVSDATTAWIDQGLNDGISFVGALSAVKSTESGESGDVWQWFVAGKLISGDVAVWGITTITGTQGQTISVNDAAKNNSDWFHGDKVRVAVKDDAKSVQSAKSCIG